MKIKVGTLKLDEINKLAEKYGAEDYYFKRINGETYLFLRQPQLHRVISLTPATFAEFKRRKREYMENRRISKLTDSNFMSILLDWVTV